MPGEEITADWQIDWNGFLLGAPTVYEWVRLDGWYDLPGLVNGNVKQPNDHGAWSGQSSAQPRTVTLTVEMVAGPDGMATSVAALRAAMAVGKTSTEYPLAVRSSGETLVAWGKVSGKILPIDQPFSLGYAPHATLQWICADPRVYELTERSLVITAPTAGIGGLTYPLSYPLSYGTAGSPNSGLAPNVGSEATKPVLVFTGPITTPRVVNTTAARALEFNIDLTAGQTLTVDTKAGTVLLNGTTDRLYTRSNLTVPVKHFELDPGANSLTLLAAAFGTGAHLEVLWRSAYL